MRAFIRACLRHGPQRTNVVRSSPRQRHASSYENRVPYISSRFISETVLHCSYGLLDLQTFCLFIFVFFIFVQTKNFFFERF